MAFHPDQFAFPPTTDKDVDVKDKLRAQQLSYIGAIALSYNNAEAAIDGAITISLERGGLFPELTSRINGIDGKKELLVFLLNQNGFLPDAMALISETIGEGSFFKLKKARDSLVHCRVIDPAKNIAKGPAKRGKQQKILISEEWLEGISIALLY